MRIDIMSLFSRAVRIVLGNRVLWPLAFLVQLTGSTLSIRTTSFSSLIGLFSGNVPSSSPSSTLAATNTAASLLSCLTTLAFFGYFLFVHQRVQAGLIIASQKSDQGEAPTLGESWNNGGRSMWTVLGLDLVLVGVGFVIAFVLFFVLIGIMVSAFLNAFGIGLSTNPGGNPSSSRFGEEFSSIIPWLACVAIFAIPTLIVLSTIVEFGKRAAALDGELFAPAWRTGWRLFSSNLGTVLLILLLEFVFALIVAIPFGLLSFGLTFFVTDAALDTFAIGSAMQTLVGIVLGLLEWLIFAALLALPIAWHSTIWTLLYRTLVPQPAVPAGGPGYGPWPQPYPPNPYAQGPQYGSGTAYFAPGQIAPSYREPPAIYSMPGRYPGGPETQALPPQPQAPPPPPSEPDTPGDAARKEE